LLALAAAAAVAAAQAVTTTVVAVAPVASAVPLVRAAQAARVAADRLPSTPITPQWSSTPRHWQLAPVVLAALVVLAVTVATAVTAATALEPQLRVLAAAPRAAAAVTAAAVVPAVTADHQLVPTTQVPELRHSMLMRSQQWQVLEPLVQQESVVAAVLSEPAEPKARAAPTDQPRRGAAMALRARQVPRAMSETQEHLYVGWPLTRAC
jgi:hypothetical protein